MAANYSDANDILMEVEFIELFTTLACTTL